MISGLFAKVNFFQPKWKLKNKGGEVEVEEQESLFTPGLHAKLYLWSGEPGGGWGCPLRSHLKMLPATLSLEHRPTHYCIHSLFLDLNI